MQYIQTGSKEYKRAKIAFLIAGLVTFAGIYTTQPTMPLFAKEFHLSAASASLTLSVTTGILAFTMLVAAILSDKIGMKRIMVFSMFATSILGLLTSFSPNFTTLLLFRSLLGVFVAGVPSIAMAFIGKEFSPKDSMVVMGFYISGSSIGGMTGRLFTGLLTDLFSWRIAFGTIGIISILLSIIFWHFLPVPKSEIKKSAAYPSIWPSYKMHLLNKNLNYLIVLGFILMGGFVTMYNYIGFSLMQEPYHLSQTAIGFIFVIYLCGTFSSVFMGKKAKKHGPITILKLSIMITIIGALITLCPSLLLKIVGLATFTFGFFASHSIVSALVAERATDNKAQASSLYLLFYYLGSSIVGLFGGFFWEHFSWIGVISFILSLLIIGIIVVFLRDDAKRIVQAQRDHKAL